LDGLPESSSLPEGGDNGLTGQDGDAQDGGLGWVGTSTISLSEILSDKNNESIGSSAADVSDAFNFDSLSSSESYREGRQSETNGGTPNGPPTLGIPSDRVTGSIGSSFSGGAAIGIGIYLSGQLSTSVGASGLSTNSAQVFVGFSGLGFVYPTPPSQFLSFSFNYSSQPPPPDKVFSGCQPSATIVTPILSIQIIEDNFTDMNPLSATISFGITAGLGVFGGVACPISLP
jgi:hypothetical protein